MLQTPIHSGIKATPFKTQLLKWIGNKQKFAHEIISYFPREFGTYIEPFIGSGAVMATLSPERAVGADTFRPLIDIWNMLAQDPETLKAWYEERFSEAASGDRVTAYERIKASYNAAPNGADFLFLSRACYGGVVRFRKKDGYMSTPCGAHVPIRPDRFARRVDLWRDRMQGAQFQLADYKLTMAQSKPGDLIYCDPPYSDSQSILYGAQGFRLQELFEAIRVCKQRGVFVALSIDGTKKSGAHSCLVPIPPGLFEHGVSVNMGRSMLRRFQMGGQTLEQELVHDRLLLTY